MFAFIQGYIVCEAEGIGAEYFTQAAKSGLSTLGGFFDQMSAKIQKKDYAGDEATIEAWSSGPKRFLKWAKERAINSEIASTHLRLLERATSEGHGQADFFLSLRDLAEELKEMQMADKEEPYKELERGKVLAIEVEADSRNALFARATNAPSRIMVQPDDVKAAHRQEIEIVDDTDVEMMHDILGAALNVFRSGLIWRDAEIEERGGPIVVWLSGEQYDPDRHRLLTEIKGVQERLVIENKDGKWRTRITFDI